MCATCGCGDDAGTRLTLYPEENGGGHAHAHDGGHHHDHEHGIYPEHGVDDVVDSVHEHQHEHGIDHVHIPVAPPAAGESAGRTVVLEQQILAKNASLAERNRGWLADRGVLAINLMSSPGSGKTTLLEQTIAGLPGRQPIAVIEGDQETPLDAERIRNAGRPVIQVNTGAGCHLDADMVHRALTALDPEPGTLIFIENVGNLVCPALFDLGEAQRVVLASVTEGADKPMKYPQMFREADVVLLNKMDLLPYVTFDLDRFSSDLSQLNPAATVIPVTATSADSMQVWFDWLTSAQSSRSGAPVLT